MANTPKGEFKFTVESIADGLTFKPPYSEESKAALVIKNADDKGRTYKIKTTSNTLFSIKGAVGFVAKGATVNVNIVCKKLEGEIPEDGFHLFSIYHIPTENKEAPRKAWTEHKGEAEGSNRVAIKFVREKKADAVEEKKEEPKKEDPKKDEPKKEEPKKESPKEAATDKE